MKGAHQAVNTEILPNHVYDKFRTNIIINFIELVNVGTLQVSSIHTLELIVFTTNSDFLISYIFANQCLRCFQTMNSVRSNNLS